MSWFGGDQFAGSARAVPSDRAPERFVLAAAGCTGALLVALRLPPVVHGLITPLTRFEAALAAWYGGTSIGVDLSCSGTDVVALCAGAMLAYPTRLSARLIAAFLSTLGVLAMNLVRIVTLARVADDPELFHTLHVFVWPAILTATAATFVFGWMWWIERRGAFADMRWAHAGAGTVAALAVFGALMPAAMASAAVVRVAAWSATIAVGMLTRAGVAASAAGNTLTTSGQAFVVTPECVLTPLIPLYLGAVLTWPERWTVRVALAVAAAPLFLLLAVVRLLALAAPVATPLHAVHSFYEIVLAIGMVGVVAQHGRRRSPFIAAIAGITVAAAVAWIAGDVYRRATELGAAALITIAPHARRAWSDAEGVQGAMTWLPVVQQMLAVAIVVASGTRRWRRAALGIGLLAATQIVLLAGVGEFEWHTATVVHPLVLRAWTIAAPLLLLMPALDAGPAAAGDRSFWDDVGEHFPDLGGAVSTAMYFRDECALLDCALGDVRGCRLLKTDLWDEAKNTRILQWLGQRGARPYGIDIAAPTVGAARRAFGTAPLHAAVADVRHLPFADASFDAVYSMGTVEHFDGTEHAVGELFRVVRPGGRVVLGVPNRHDPFLRPVMVGVLRAFDAYGYGYEKSYSRRDLRRMLERAGFEVEHESGILFVPGWLRILDLWCHTRGSALAPAVASAVRAFAALSARFPSLRRHGYLIASVGVRPASSR
jgi:exosortase/archaeosortase family protein